MGRPAALVTGASSGIGAELARLCAADGFDLVLVARDAERLAELADRVERDHRVQARVLPADLSDPKAPTQIFEQMQGAPVDILINNAGYGMRGAFAETDWAAGANLMQVNMTAPVHLSRLFLPGMIQRRSGRILNVASTAAFVPGPFLALYYASKAFLLSFSEAIASEVKGTGVTVTALCPGPTRSEFARRAGVESSKLFHGPVMTAAAVAHEGYRAMMAGKPRVIAGARNRWLMRGVRFAPRSIVVEQTRKLNLE
jgi:short-subunit dehydrogenase